MDGLYYGFPWCIIYIKREGNFQNNCLHSIVALPYFQNISVKRLTMPQSKVISLEIIPIWQLVLAAIFIYGTSSHVQKQLPLLCTNVKHTQCKINHTRPQQYTNNITFWKAMWWNCCIGRTTPQKVRQTAFLDSLFLEEFSITKPSESQMSMIVEYRKGFE